jgi:hypothetical protein
MRYILGYFALMLGLSGLGMLIAGNVLGFFLILAAAALIYWIFHLERERRRGQRFGEYGPAIEGYEKHFAATSRALEAKLPQDALDNPALLELLSGEDAERSDAIRADYARLRQRFHAWQEDFERLHEQTEAGAIGLPGPFAEHYARLDRELSELLEEVERLEARAAEAKSFGDNPLEEVARAALKLEQATSLCRAAFGAAVPGELGAELARGTERLAEARRNLEKDSERPLVAARLAREAYALADGVSRRAQELVDQPREASIQRSDLERTCARLVDEVAAAKAKLDLAREHYAPACLQAIGGLEASAEQAVEQARSLIASAEAPSDAFRLVEARTSLSRATELVGRIEHHLAELEQAALRAPGLVDEAELASDRAWANATASTGVEAGAELIVTRSRELAGQARTELAQARPDWFRVLSLANRALEVVRELAPAPTRELVVREVQAAGGNEAVGSARRAAEAALAEARPLVRALEERAGAENMASLCLESGEFAFSKGAALESEIASAENEAAVAGAAIESYKLAVDAAEAAQEHAVFLGGRRGSGTPGPRWGRFGTAFESE